MSLCITQNHLSMLSCHDMQGDALLVTYMRDVASVLQLRSLATGALVRELPVPAYGSVKEVCGRESLSQMYYSYESMTDPGSTYMCDLFPPSLRVRAGFMSLSQPSGNDAL